MKKDTDEGSCAISHCPASTKSFPTNIFSHHDPELNHFAINTTIHCQHKCVYCFEGDRTGKRHLSTDEVKELIRSAADQVPSIVFMGAETTLRKDFVEIVAFAKKCGLWPAVSTNALKFSDMKFLSAALEAGLGTIELSFHYPDEKVYQSITRSKASGFKLLLNALDNINIIISRFPSVTVTINTVVSSLNCERLHEISGLLEKHLSQVPLILNLQRVYFNRVTPEENYNVPLKRLRDIFVPLLCSWGKPFPVVFKGFPLCAIPGYEHLDAELMFVTKDIRQNFFSQKQYRPMYVTQSYVPGKYVSICTGCSLDSLCLERGLLSLELGETENAPSASSRSPHDVLLANGIETENIDTVLNQLTLFTKQQGPEEVVENIFASVCSASKCSRDIMQFRIMDDSILSLKFADGTGCRIYFGPWNTSLTFFLPAGSAVVGVHGEKKPLPAVWNVIKDFAKALSQTDLGSGFADDSSEKNEVQAIRSVLRIIENLSVSEKNGFHLEQCHVVQKENEPLILFSLFKTPEDESELTLCSTCRGGTSECETVILKGRVSTLNAGNFSTFLSRSLDVYPSGILTQEAVSAIQKAMDQWEKKNQSAPLALGGVFGNRIYAIDKKKDSLVSMRIMLSLKDYENNVMCSNRVVLQPENIFFSKSCEKWLYALCRAVAEVTDKIPVHESEQFHTIAWRTFGELLWPGKKGFFIVESSTVSAKEMRLAISDNENDKLVILIKLNESTIKAYAANEHLAISYIGAGDLSPFEHKVMQVYEMKLRRDLSLS